MNFPYFFQVEYVFHRTVASLCDMSTLSYTRFRPRTASGPDRGYTLRAHSTPLSAPPVELPGHTIPLYLGTPKIWGLTALFLHQVMSVLTPEYKLKIRHPGDLRRKS